MQKGLDPLVPGTAGSGIRQRKTPPLGGVCLLRTVRIARLATVWKIRRIETNVNPVVDQRGVEPPELRVTSRASAPSDWPTARS